MDAAADAGAGCFVLVRTSNPGAAEIQDEGDPPLYERLARLVDELGRERLGDCGLSAVGAVTGATRPEHLVPAARADAARRVPAAGSRGPGRQGRGPRPSVRPASRRRARHGLALDRERSRRAWGRPRGGGGRGGGGAARGRLGRSKGARRRVPSRAGGSAQSCPGKPLSLLFSPVPREGYGTRCTITEDHASLACWRLWH